MDLRDEWLVAAVSASRIFKADAGPIAGRVAAAGSDSGIRRRVHYFTDWQPLKDYPALKQLLEPRD